jgi:hypothetical protein
MENLTPFGKNIVKAILLTVILVGLYVTRNIYNF